MGLLNWTILVCAICIGLICHNQSHPTHQSHQCEVDVSKYQVLDVTPFNAIKGK